MCDLELVAATLHSGRREQYHYSAQEAFNQQYFYQRNDTEFPLFSATFYLETGLRKVLGCWKIIESKKTNFIPYVGWTCVLLYMTLCFFQVSYASNEHPAASVCTGNSPQRRTLAMDKDTTFPVIKVNITSKLCMTLISITACLL